MDRIAKIALLGIGKMGQNHLRILSMLKDVDIAFIYDINEEACKEIAKKFILKYMHLLNTQYLIKSLKKMIYLNQQKMMILQNL